MCRRFTAHFLRHPRRWRIARRMAAAGWPRYAICRALGIRAERLAAAMARADLRGPAEVALFRRAA
ncbi:hypothetical protein [Chelatococcus composti]|uniref:Uncharacterized protein n=1 Tax=Chelatococcus composti TaxID=1743235 RepID=A0A841KAZ9_9HYPH|nr:hypothetical protein [Chelatococcus composti]MBB6169465.1 hypothetical protein [Chelatococcus composti]MBS7737028.1 hypothetical protein [Chelatococcus composti]GGG47953.1 hypothetical protein GCM10008026_31500 [Chelatococcus composti]